MDAAPGMPEVRARRTRISASGSSIITTSAHAATFSSIVRARRLTSSRRMPGAEPVALGNRGTINSIGHHPLHVVSEALRFCRPVASLGWSDHDSFAAHRDDGLVILARNLLRQALLGRGGCLHDHGAVIGRDGVPGPR